jgi:hypothetical protein
MIRRPPGMIYLPPWVGLAFQFVDNSSMLSINIVIKSLLLALQMVEICHCFDRLSSPPAP